MCLTVTGARIERARVFFFFVFFKLIYNEGRSDGRYGAGWAELRKEQQVEEVKGER